MGFESKEILNKKHLEKPLSSMLIMYHIQFISINLGGQSGAAVRRPHGYVHDVGSHPAATRNEKRTLGGPPTEGAPMVQQDLSGRPAMLNLN